MGGIHEKIDGWNTWEDIKEYVGYPFKFYMHEVARKLSNRDPSFLEELYHLEKMATKLNAAINKQHRKMDVQMRPYHAALRAIYEMKGNREELKDLVLNSQNEDLTKHEKKVILKKWKKQDAKVYKNLELEDSTSTEDEQFLRMKIKEISKAKDQVDLLTIPTKKLFIMLQTTKDAIRSIKENRLYNESQHTSRKSKKGPLYWCCNSTNYWGKSSHLLVFSEDLFFIYLLPPIIFNAG